MTGTGRLVAAILAVTLTLAGAKKDPWQNLADAVLAAYYNVNFTAISSDLLDKMKTDPPAEFTKACADDVKAFLEGILVKKLWALEVLDNSGKAPPGVKGGNLDWLGSYDRCRRQKLPKDVPFSRTAYFSASFGFPHMMKDQIKYGLCLPNSCKKGDVQKLMTSAIQVFDGSEYSVNESFAVYGVKSYETRSTPTSGFIMGTILAFYAIFMIVATLYDVVLQSRVRKTNHAAPPTDDMQMNGIVPDTPPDGAQGETDPVEERNSESRKENGQETGKKQQSLCSALVLSFSVYTNGRKLLSATDIKGALTCLYGLRFFSMLWIIMGHTYFYEAILGHMDNFNDFWTYLLPRWDYKYNKGGVMAVETFFFMSGCLVSYLTLPELAKAGGHRKFKWWYFYLHRWWRLTPPYLILLASHVLITPYVYDGPNWVNTELRCQTVVYTNILYVNDLFVGCMGWSWFLAADFKLFVLSPIFLIAFNRNWKAGLGSVIGATAVHWICAFVISFLTHFNPATFEESPVYFPFVFHLGPYTIGMAIGYILHRAKTKPVVVKPAVQAICWLVAMIFCVGTTWGADQGFYGIQPVISLYLAIHSTLWALGLAWLVVACCTGYGGFVNTLLSWSPMIPLSRLTYCAYLVHPIYMTIYALGQRTLFNATELTLNHLFMGNVVMSYLMAFVASVSFESPMIAIEKAFRKHCKSSACCRRQKPNPPPADTTPVVQHAHGSDNVAVHLDDVNGPPGQLENLGHF